MAKNSVPNFDLPAEKMFSVQVGDRLFRLSGASLSSDAPSYFTCFFAKDENDGKILFIDRSPVVFDKIYMHLQGYHVSVLDEMEFIYLLADANYFSLNKLKSQLINGDVFAKIGSRSFRIPRKLISGPGNYPNFFSIAYDSLLRDPFGIDELKDLLRPPPQEPLIVFSRSDALFEELLYGLQGHEIVFQNEKHRENLLFECRYYRFLALEQKLVNHKITVNPFTRAEEITINLKDVKKQGLLNPSPNDGSQDFLVKYSRPYVDESILRDLIVQVENTDINLLVSKTSKMVSLFILGKTARQIYKLFSTLTNDIMYEELKNGNETTPKVTMLVQMIGCNCVLNGQEMKADWLEKIINEDDSPEEQMLRESELPDESLYRIPGPRRAIPSLPPPSVPENKDVIAIRVLKSQWSFGTRGQRLWMNGRKLTGVTDCMSWQKANAFI
ncbi:unnamed protein product [Kuraishia capsulata CBS 1993]|uniref:Potassium channel tetramerisation-type BTB domain-containing protein n=1 Tax=Kuraishia capsulata CBS 1993 TaxID=1382522 RepID=W6MH58_9ASCO|nr:uncharacterized protein KUCA_T00001248001 [Kuraishia capsulata CBS 1993]CDK25281.1 unnamed protein product [Kuraishia capsulata CBS 1993]